MNLSLPFMVRSLLWIHFPQLAKFSLSFCKRRSYVQWLHLLPNLLRLLLLSKPLLLWNLVNVSLKDCPLYTHCGVLGHMHDRCFKLHSFPLGYDKFKGKPAPVQPQVHHVAEGSSGLLLVCKLDLLIPLMCCPPLKCNNCSVCCNSIRMVLSLTLTVTPEFQQVWFSLPVSFSVALKPLVRS